MAEVGGRRAGAAAKPKAHQSEGTPTPSASSAKKPVRPASVPRARRGSLPLSSTALNTAVPPSACHSSAVYQPPLESE